MRLRSTRASDKTPVKRLSPLTISCEKYPMRNIAVEWMISYLFVNLLFDSDRQYSGEFNVKSSIFAPLQYLFATSSQHFFRCGFSELPPYHRCHVIPLLRSLGIKINKNTDNMILGIWMFLHEDVLWLMQIERCCTVFQTIECCLYVNKHLLWFDFKIIFTNTF